MMKSSVLLTALVLCLSLVVHAEPAAPGVPTLLERQHNFDSPTPPPPPLQQRPLILESAEPAPPASPAPPERQQQQQHQHLHRLIRDILDAAVTPATAQNHQIADFVRQELDRAHIDVASLAEQPQERAHNDSEGGDNTGNNYAPIFGGDDRINAIGGRVHAPRQDNDNDNNNNNNSPMSGDTFASLSGGGLVLVLPAEPEEATERADTDKQETTTTTTTSGIVVTDSRNIRTTNWQVVLNLNLNVNANNNDKQNRPVPSSDPLRQPPSADAA